jgi:hypothetical protein
VKDIKSFFQAEIETRRKTINKYKKASTALSWTAGGCAAIAFACEITSIPLIATGIAAIVGLALEGAGIGIGALAIPAGVGTKKIRPKLEKHIEIYILAVSKLNSINDLIAKALEDGHLDANEYRTILTEHEKYIGLKNAIRKKTLQENNSELNVEELKKEFMEKGKQMGKQEMLKLLKSEQ